MFNLSQNCPPAETSQGIGAERLLDQPRRTFGFVQNYLGQEQGAGRNDLAGLGQLIATHRPDYIFLQEVMVTREQLEGQDGRSASLA